MSTHCPLASSWTSSHMDSPLKTLFMGHSLTRAESPCGANSVVTSTSSTLYHHFLCLFLEYLKAKPRTGCLTHKHFCLPIILCQADLLVPQTRWQGHLNILREQGVRATPGSDGCGEMMGRGGGGTKATGVPRYPKLLEGPRCGQDCHLKEMRG